jgi:hypothetical protein
MTTNVKILELINEDHHQIIHELAGTIGITYGAHQILSKIVSMCHIATKFVFPTLDE